MVHSHDIEPGFLNAEYGLHGEDWAKEWKTGISELPKYTISIWFQIRSTVKMYHGGLDITVSWLHVLSGTYRFPISDIVHGIFPAYSKETVITVVAMFFTIIPSAMILTAPK